MDFILPLALGLAIGAAILFLALRNKTVQQDSAPNSSTDLASSVQGVVQSALNEALSALNEQSRRDREESIKLAADRVAEASSERLGKSAKDIDTSLRSVQESLSQRMQQMDIEIKRLHDQNAEKFGNVDRAVNDLVKRTSDLNNVLSSSQARGQWGERMAEDMLRAAGFIEGANYKKQNTIEGGGRPDYTFMMPPDRVLYMDVKFPMDSYTAFVAAVDQTSRDSLKKDFIAAVRARVTELQKRDYAVVTTEHSLDYVLLYPRGRPKPHRLGAGTKGGAVLAAQPVCLSCGHPPGNRKFPHRTGCISHDATDEQVQGAMGEVRQVARSGEEVVRQDAG
jgi:DNA anti-recombination protein RmuC